jgi:hypothetical protein
MASTHGKSRSEMSHKQVFAHIMIAFNGPIVPNFAAKAHLTLTTLISCKLYQHCILILICIVKFIDIDMHSKIY